MSHTRIALFQREMSALIVRFLSVSFNRSINKIKKTLVLQIHTGAIWKNNLSAEELNIPGIVFAVKMLALMTMTNLKNLAYIKFNLSISISKAVWWDSGPNSRMIKIALRAFCKRVTKSLQRTRRVAKIAMYWTNSRVKSFWKTNFASLLPLSEYLSLTNANLIFWLSKTS